MPLKATIGKIGLNLNQSIVRTTLIREEKIETIMAESWFEHSLIIIVLKSSHTLETIVQFEQTTRFLRFATLSIFH